MAKITVNNIKTITVDIENIASVDFNYLGHKVYSASEVRRVYGSYISSVIVGSSAFLRWGELSWVGAYDQTSSVYFYMRSSNTEEGLEDAEWEGTFNGQSNDVSNLTGRFAQILVVLRNDGVSNGLPRIDSMRLSFLTAENALRFYTKSFDVGFTPKHAVLTYNAVEDDDAVIRFAISGEDTPDTSKYQYIEPNKIVRLDALTYLSNSVKILVEIVGSSDSQAVVDEISVMLGGDEATRINKVFLESSSSSSSSESSSESESSSSSIDSSSSSSFGNSSSSSSSSAPYVTVGAGDTYEVAAEETRPIEFAFTGEEGETATITLNTIYDYTIGNVAEKFVWDIGGLDEHTFTTFGEAIVQNAGGIDYNIVWDGFGSLLFTLQRAAESSSSSSFGESSSSSSFGESSSSSSLGESSSSSESAVGIGAAEVAITFMIG